MFQKEAFNQFYEYNEGEDTQVGEAIKNAYFVFIGKLCVHSSYVWKDYLKAIEIGDEGTYSSYLTASDEALTWWTILTKYDRTNEDAKYITQFGKDNWEQNRNKKSPVRTKVMNKSIFMLTFTIKSKSFEKIKTGKHFGKICFLKNGFHNLVPLLVLPLTSFAPKPKDN